MLRKVLIFILCVSMILPTITLEIQAVEYERKFLSIKRLNDEVLETYEVITDGDKVYIGVDDLMEVSGFDEKIEDITDDTINKITLRKKSYNGVNQKIEIFPKDNKIISILHGEKEFKGCLQLEKNVYLDLIEIFNYLRIKADVIENQLLVNIPVYTIFDFMIYDYQEVLKNSVSQLDLLENQEGSFSSGFFDALSLACNNFDFKLLIPIWGANELKDEQYIKALQTLNEDDDLFYNENSKEYIKSKLAERGLEGILASGKDLVNVMSIGGKTIETSEDIIACLENASAQETINTFMNLVNWNGENYDGFMKLRVWNKYAESIDDAISCADIAVSAYETYSRAKNWNQECLNNLEVLKNLDIDNYGEHKEYVKRIKKLAEKCYQEKINKSGAVAEQTVEDVSTLLFEKAMAETSVYGKVMDYFILATNTGISVAKCFGNVAEEMDKAELSYMVTCLINIAVASRIDAEIEYEKINLSDTHSGEIEKFRNSIKTAIKCNLRCWSYIYYLNSDGEWENTYRGKEVKNKIDKMNTYLTLLKESAQYDYALDDYDLNIYNPKKIVEILKNDELTLKEGTYRYTSDEFFAELRVENVNGNKQCYWGEWYGPSASIEDFEFIWIDGIYDYEVIGWRSKQLIKVNIELQEQSIIISVFNTEGEMYFNQGEVNNEFKAEYKLVNGKPALSDEISKEETEDILIHFFYTWLDQWKYEDKQIFLDSWKNNKADFLDCLQYIDPNSKLYSSLKVDSDFGGRLSISVALNIQNVDMKYIGNNQYIATIMAYFTQNSVDQTMYEKMVQNGYKTIQYKITINQEGLISELSKLD